MNRQFWTIHGERVYKVSSIALLLAVNALVLWLKDTFVTRAEFDRHCEAQSLVVSNFLAHVQITPMIVQRVDARADAQDRAIDAIDGRVRTLETRPWRNP